jgi:uncharacterized protein YsxB (DUF464 family)
MKPYRELGPIVEIRNFARSKLQELDKQIVDLLNELRRSEEKAKECPCIELEISMKISNLQKQRVAVELLIDKINEISNQYAEYVDPRSKPRF